MPTRINLETKEDRNILHVMETSKGTPLKLIVDRRTKMLHFTQHNDGVTDQVHMSLDTFTTLIKFLGIEQVIEGNYDLVSTNLLLEKK